MKRRILLTLLAAALATAATGQSTAKQATADSAPNINLALNALMMAAIPEPADDPLLDATGAPVLDATGHPVSDPNEGFHKVIPSVYDPDQTHLVQSTWLDGIGCPTNATVRQFRATPPFDLLPPSKYTDPACTTGDPKDKHNEGLLMAKTGPTNDTPAAVATLKKVRGTVLTELGYDIRKYGKELSLGDKGSHCGAGAPRFNIVTADGTLYFLGCNSPMSVDQTGGDGFVRLRWGTTTPLMAYNSAGVLVPISGMTVKSISIIFDEGYDTGPDFFGAAVLDNIDVNGKLVGRGPAGPGMKEDDRNDDDDDD
jgi:hypothetical protein